MSRSDDAVGPPLQQHVSLVSQRSYETPHKIASLQAVAIDIVGMQLHHDKLTAWRGSGLFSTILCRLCMLASSAWHRTFQSVSEVPVCTLPCRQASSWPGVNGCCL